MYPNYEKSGPDAGAEYPSDEELFGFTTQRTAKILSTSLRKVRRMINAGELEAFRVGRQNRITKASIKRFQRANRVAVKP